MKISITGHTQGIGKACWDQLGAHSLQGFSRSNGFELPAQNHSVARASRGCDAIIINAAPHGQLELFKLMYAQWQHQQGKHIIVIGSRASYMDPRLNDYYRIKNQLREHIINCQMTTNRACKITQIHPGFVDCGVVKDRTDVVKADPQEVAEAVKWCLSRPYEVGELSMWYLDK